MANASTPLKVVLLGFDDRSRETMRLIFQGPGKGCCLLTDEQQAEAAIINLDSVDGRSLCEGYRQQHAEHPVILMAVRDPGENDAIFLSKPVRQDELLNTVQGLALQSREAKTFATSNAQATVAAATAPTPAPPAPRKKPAVVERTMKDEDFYDPQQFLQGALQKLLASSQPKETAFKLKIANGDTVYEILLIPGLDRALHKISTTQLAQLCSTPAFLLKLAERRYSARESLELEIEVRSKGLGEPLAAFMWKVARYTSYGRLPLGTDIAAPAYLSHWPNFTRLPASDRAMRISALLVEQARPLPLVARVLNIPLKDVFAFYSAAHAVGLAGISQRSADHLVQADTPSPPRQHGLFGSLLKRLKNISKSAA